MQRRLRRNHTPALKAKVALAAGEGDRTLAQLAEQFDVHPNQITSWKAQLESGAADVLDSWRWGRRGPPVRSPATSQSAWMETAPGGDNVFVERLWRSVKYLICVISAEPSVIKSTNPWRIMAEPPTRTPEITNPLFRARQSENVTAKSRGWQIARSASSLKRGEVGGRIGQANRPPLQHYSRTEE